MKRKTIMGLEYKWEVLIVYLFSILGLIFSCMKDKKIDDDVKFQYNQSGTMFIMLFALNTISILFDHMIGLAIISLVAQIFSIVIFIFAIVTIVKAFNNETYEMPIVSDLSKMIWK